MTTILRPAYGHEELKRVLDPRSIAVVGASPKQGSFGARLLGNLQGYAGDVYLVNAKYDRLGDLPCYPSLSALPTIPDCVAVTVPREAAEAVVTEAAEVGAGGVIIYASGYAETGKPERIAQQRRLSEVASASQLRILGPNCLGIANYVRGARITFAEYPQPRPLAGAAVGIASQSGALSQALAQAAERGLSVSHALSAGNQCDVDVADLIAYLAHEPSCRAIACVFEGMAEPMRLLEAADVAWQAKKPLLIHKLATGELGALAAVSHTGSLAGSNAAYRAAFERAGVIVIDQFEGLMEAAAFFAKAPPPKARGVAVIATSGGAAIMAADKAEVHGIPLPQPSDAVRCVLEQHIPDFGSCRNPCDVTAQVVNHPESLWACGEALMSQSDYGVVIVPQPVAFDFHAPRVLAFGELSRRFGKITCNVLISDWLQGPASREAEAHPHVAIFRSMDRCMSTLAAWQRRHERQQGGVRVPNRRASASAAQQIAPDLVATQARTLTERESKKILAAYGVPVVGERLVHDADEAAAAAREFGFPVALKVESPDLPHKTEAGVIRLNLRSETELRLAYAAILENAHRTAPPPQINGVLVQPMIPPGVELMIGGRVDPLLGPLIMVGLGGVMVEVLKDTRLELAPVTTAEAFAMLKALKGFALLSGFRGSQAVNLEAIVDVVCRLSELVADHRSSISEMDINPLICSSSRIVAVDALIVTQPRAALRPAG